MGGHLEYLCVLMLTQRTDNLHQSSLGSSMILLLLLRFKRFLMEREKPPAWNFNSGCKNTPTGNRCIIYLSLFSPFLFFFWVCETDRHTRQREVIIWSRGTSTHRMGDIMMNKVQRREWGSKGHTSASSSVHPCGSEEEKRNKFREGDRLYVQPAANSGRRRGGGGFKREEKRA